MGVVTQETIETIVNLLDGWQKLLLREEQRASFMNWLRAHTRLEFQPRPSKKNYRHGFQGSMISNNSTPMS